MMHSKTQDDFPITIPYSFHGYQFIQLLGCGSTCIVALVENQITHEKFAAKVISKKDIVNRNMLKSVSNEINVLKTLSHPHIIKLQESFEIKNENEEYIVIIMEYCENGDLLSYAVNQVCPNDLLMKKIIIGFLEAVKYLHHKGISHGDIKAENILLDSNLSPKLCDFGYCRTNLIAGDESKNGTLYYAAPELFQKGEFNTLKTDIYAIGITLYSLAELQFPFKDGDQGYIVKQIINGRLSISNGLNNQLRQLVIRCTTKEPMHRPNIGEVLNDKYLSDTEITEKNNNIQEMKKLSKLLTDNKKSEEKLISDDDDDELIIFESD